MPAEDAEAICKAIEDGSKLVQVRFEESPGSNVVQRTTLVTAHVISLYEVPQTQRELLEAAGPKVSAIGRRRS